MKKSISVSKKPTRGRPKKVGGIDPVSAVRLPADLTSKIDDWAVSQELTRSEAIRRLVELGFSVKTAVPKGRTGKAADRAAELASKMIDSQLDPDMPISERAERKRRILKGPSDFREVRKDRPK